MGLTIRNITMDDRAAIFGWVEALGWNPGEKDGECLLATDPDGMFMAERDGVAVGCATAIAYDEHFGFVGALVVDPAMRSKGPATMLAIYRHVLAYLGVRNGAMDAMPATQKFFADLGCVPVYRHWRFEGVLPIGQPAGTVIPLSEVSFEALCDYDAAQFPARRERFLRVWLEAYGSGGRACVRDGRLAGFGVLRRARSGWRVGPLLADDPEAAEDLLRAMSTMSRGEQVALDVPEANPAAMTLVKRLGLVGRVETTRMVKPRGVDMTPDRVYSIASYEFG